jgi:hypothetical protein
MESMVHRVRNKQFSNTTGAIRVPPLVNCSDEIDSKIFLVFDINVLVKGKLVNIIGWGHPDLIHILKTGPKYIFIDCTFKCTPSIFAQCMVIVIYESATELYLPVFYILLPSKDEMVYRYALRHCIGATNSKFEGDIIFL